MDFVTLRSRRPRERRSLSPSIVAFWLGAAVLSYVVVLGPNGFAFGAAHERARVRGLPLVQPARNAFGKSGDVRLRVALPGAQVEYPLEVQGEPEDVRYAWVAFGRDSIEGSPRSLVEKMVAPERPGFYRLAIMGADGAPSIVDSLALAVLVPFTAKSGAALNGYRIGFYGGERRGRTSGPDGFVEIASELMDLPISRHLRVADFLSRDGQTSWPRYAALDPRLLDKIELVLDELDKRRTLRKGTEATVDVHSGFRTPSHNRRVLHAARDSRHQYGDAADLRIDANGDGRINGVDLGLIAKAVDTVEELHPELAGGLGLYSQTGSSYVHIDARGQRVRWRS
jgi:uncharacterized protein YcbK (DUF882 family)